MIDVSTVHPWWLISASFVLSLLPLVVGAATSYLKISVVIGMLKNGLGLQQSPSTMVVMVLSFVLSGYIMAPVIEQTYTKIKSSPLPVFSKTPTVNDLPKVIDYLQPWVSFLEAHAGQRERAVLEQLDTTSANREQSNQDQGKDEQAPTSTLRILLPAFVLTELKEAFAMGFILLLPFLVIDLIVANILAGLGMFMVSPAMISLPLKLLLFSSADGWLFLSRALILSYGGSHV